ncbi:MAG: DUF2254 domain-containing protein [Rhodobacteraceae bacterium]|nr:DUF2254 domain-containing protein [Paracoccaceae bacterium]
MSTTIATRTIFHLRRLTRRIWVRTTAFAILAFIAAGASRPLAGLLPDALLKLGDAETVLNILSVLSSSMLAVTTFSLGVIVSARQAISSTITPRAHEIVAGDPVTQRVLAVFMGAFVYALTAQILIRTQYYDDRASSVVMLVSLFVMALVVAAMLRWIEHLTQMGSVADTVQELEARIEPAFAAWRRHPAFGAAPGDPTAHLGVQAITARRAGYVQHIDLFRLQELAETAGGTVLVAIQIGDFVLPGAPLARMAGAEPESAEISAAFTLGETRTFEQDVRFGVIVLAEIAQRALSPAVNDPGTAIYILNRITRLIAGPDGPTRADPPACPRVVMAPIAGGELVRDGFDGIARDGAAMVEVQVRLMKCLAALARRGDASVAERAGTVASRAAAHSAAALALEEDRARLNRLAAEVGRTS